MESRYKKLTESERKEMLSENKVCSQEETLQYVQSFGMLSADELLLESRKIIDEIWDNDEHE